MFGYSFENPEIANGTKYLAVLTAPIEMRPAVFPAIISSEVSQDCDRGLDALGERKHFAAGIRQQHAVAGALDQRQAGQRLQISKLKRDRRLREMKLLRRGGDRAGACERRPARATGEWSIPAKTGSPSLPPL